MNLNNRTIVVTGAGSGIGAALAIEAAKRGAAAVAAIDLQADAAQQVAARIADSGTNAKAYACDVADTDAVAATAARVIEDLGVPGLVCANAGVSPAVGNVLEQDPHDFAWVQSVNVLGVFSTLRAFAQPMLAAGEPGWLMATASEHGLGVAHLGIGSYTASKHAVMGLCDVIRGELPEHVGISVLCPGLVKTELWQTSRLRPQAAGGPVEPDPIGASVMERGLDTATLAERALDGVEAKRFIVATHPHSKAYAAKRWADVCDSFDALRAAGVAETSYDLNVVLADVLGSG